jgi:DNA-binding GntR family transcriptional regulator
MTAAATALVELRGRILSGSLPAGTKLHQARLARELGMSRIPIRDALLQLATEGLVLQHNRTAVVAPVGLEDLAELYELRLAVEPRASAVAVAKAGPGEMDRMQELLASMEGPIDNRTWLELHDQFHATLYRGSGRPRMIAILDQARAQTRRYTGMRLERGIADLNLEHRLILGAVERGEPETVRRLLEAHLTSAWAIVGRQLETHQENEGSVREGSGIGGEPPDGTPHAPTDRKGSRTWLDEEVA